MDTSLKNLIFILSVLLLFLLIIEFILGSIHFNTLENFETTNSSCVKNTTIQAIDTNNTADVNYCSNIDLERVRIKNNTGYTNNDSEYTTIFNRYDRDPFQLDCCANFHYDTDPSYCTTLSTDDNYYYLDSLDKVDENFNFVFDYQDNLGNKLGNDSNALTGGLKYNGADTTCTDQLQYTINLKNYSGIDKCKLNFGLNPS